MITLSKFMFGRILNRVKTAWILMACEEHLFEVCLCSKKNELWYNMADVEQMSPQICMKLMASLLHVAKDA